MKYLYCALAVFNLMFFGAMIFFDYEPRKHNVAISYLIIAILFFGLFLDK